MLSDVGVSMSLPTDCGKLTSRGEDAAGVVVEMTEKLVRLSMYCAESPNSTPFGMHRPRASRKPLTEVKQMNPNGRMTRLARTCQPKRCDGDTAPVYPPTSGHVTTRRRRRLFSQPDMLLSFDQLTPEGADCVVHEQRNSGSRETHVTDVVAVSNKSGSANPDEVTFSDQPGSADLDEVTVSNESGSANASPVNVTSTSENGRTVDQTAVTPGVCTAMLGGCSRYSSPLSPLSPVIGTRSAVRRTAPVSSRLARQLPATCSPTLRAAAPQADVLWRTLVSSEDEEEVCGWTGGNSCSSSVSVEETVYVSPVVRRSSDDQSALNPVGRRSKPTLVDLVTSDDDEELAELAGHLEINNCSDSDECNRSMDMFQTAIDFSCQHDDEAQLADSKSDVTSVGSQITEMQLQSTGTKCDVTGIKLPGTEAQKADIPLCIYGEHRTNDVDISLLSLRNLSPQLCSTRLDLCQDSNAPRITVSPPSPSTTASGETSPSTAASGAGSPSTPVYRRTPSPSTTASVETSPSTPVYRGASPPSTTPSVETSPSTPVYRRAASPSTTASGETSPSTPVYRRTPSPSTTASGQGSPSTPVYRRAASPSTTASGETSPSTPVYRRGPSPSITASRETSPPIPISRRVPSPSSTASGEGSPCTTMPGISSSRVSSDSGSCDEIEDFKRRFVTPGAIKTRAVSSGNMSDFINDSSESDSSGDEGDSADRLALYHRLRPELSDQLKLKSDTFIHGSDSSLEAADFESPKEKNYIRTPSPPRRVINRAPSSARARHSVHSRQLSFLSSLASHVTEGSVRHPDADRFLVNFRRHRLELAARVFSMLNQHVFQQQLPDDLQIQFNNRLQSTAGYCYNWSVGACIGEVTRMSRIDLSTKVVDCCERLRDTLVHELCHAISWIVSGCRSGHGPVWRRWTQLVVRRFPELPAVTRCHAYSISYRFTYRCTDCGYSIGRHSRSLDTRRKVCGRCRGRFTCERTPAAASKGEGGSATRPLTAFAAFVREKYGETRQPDMKHADVMRLLSQQFAAAKIATHQQAEESPTAEQ